MTKQEQDDILTLINKAGIADAETVQALHNFVQAQAEAIAERDDMLAGLREANKALHNERDHYRAELQRLQQARGKHNRRKALRIAKSMLADAAREGRLGDLRDSL